MRPPLRGDADGAIRVADAVVTSDARRAPIGLVTAIALVVGNMVGSGLFLLPASLAPYGGAALLGWAASALGALTVAWVFARLSRRWRGSGGPYTYARAAFGDGVGFLIAWSYWVSTWCGNAAIAIAFAGYARALLPASGAAAWQGSLLAVGALWACTAFNVIGLRSAGRIQVVTAVIKLVPLLAIGVAAAGTVDAVAWQPFNRSGESLWSVLGATATLTLWAFLGVESATVPAASVRDADRNVARATLVGSVIAVALTISACMAVVGLVPAAQLAASGAPFADAASLLWGAPMGTAFAAAAAVACFGALNGWVLVQGQVPMAAARDGVFPSVFARVDRNGTPIRGLLIGSALASALVLANFHKTLVQLFTFSILLSTAATLLAYLVCSAAALWIDGAEARRPEPRSTVVLAGLAFAFSAGALAASGGEALVWGAGLLLAGWPVFRFVRRPAPR